MVPQQSLSLISTLSLILSGGRTVERSDRLGHGGPHELLSSKRKHQGKAPAQYYQSETCLPGDSVRILNGGWHHALSVLCPPEQQQHPWLLAAKLFLRRCHPGFLPLAVFTSTWQGPWLGARVLPPALQRVVAVLGHLPPMEDIAGKPLATGPWCWAAHCGATPSYPARQQQK